jgi:hypothetical protein
MMILQIYLRFMSCYTAKQVAKQRPVTGPSTLLSTSALKIPHPSITMVQEDFIPTSHLHQYHHKRHSD